VNKFNLIDLFVDEIIDVRVRIVANGTQKIVVGKKKN